MAGASGKKLDDTYKLAWLRGLKTTYYLRTMSATHAEKSTVTAGRLNAVSSGSAAHDGARHERARSCGRSARKRRWRTAGDRHQVLRDRRSDVRGLPVKSTVGVSQTAMRCN